MEAKCEQFKNPSNRPVLKVSDQGDYFLVTGEFVRECWPKSFNGFRTKEELQRYFEQWP